MLRMIVTRARELGAPKHEQPNAIAERQMAVHRLAVQGAVHLGLSKSGRLELAHDQGGTALHQAA